MSVETPVNETEWTIGRLLTWTSDYLASNGVEEARLASEVLLAHALECRRIDLYARSSEFADDAPLVRFRELVRRAASLEPIAYLVGSKEFFSLSFVVTGDVLIPRPETETLVEVVLDLCKQAGWAQPRILDVGTGSGCICVTLLKNLKNAVAVGTDVSRGALEIARGNAERHGVADRLTLVEADRLALPEDAAPAGGFHVVVSNPPYVPKAEVETLPPTVRDYEPMAALCDGEDGLSFYRSLSAGALRILTPDGLMALEVGDDQAPAVIETVLNAGRWSHQATVKDRVVGQDRVIVFAPDGSTDV